MENKWPEVKLGPNCSKIGSGATPRGGSQVYLEKGDIAFIRSQNVHNEGFNYNGLTFINREHAEQLVHVSVEENDILLNITGNSVARCCQVDPTVLPARVNQHVVIIRPFPEVFNSRFLRYFLISPRQQSLMFTMSHAGATRKALTKGMIESFKVPIPNIQTQLCIAHILGSLDDKIELNRRMNQTLETIARTIFKSWFVDFDPVHARRGKSLCSPNSGLPDDIVTLFPDSFEESELGEIPRGWKVVPLPEMIDINPIRTLKKGQIAPYLEMKNMSGNSARVLDWYDRECGSGVKFINGDTLMARITPCLENGKGAFVDFLEDNQVGWGSTEYMVFRAKKPLPLNYSYFLSKTADFRSYAIINMTGSSGRQRVPNSIFDYYLVIKPNEEVTKYFGIISEPIMQRIKKNNEEIRTLTSLRDTLLPKLISGKLRIPDAEEFIKEAGV